MSLRVIELHWLRAEPILNHETAISVITGSLTFVSAVAKIIKLDKGLYSSHTYRVSISYLLTFIAVI